MSEGGRLDAPTGGNHRRRSRTARLARRAGFACLLAGVAVATVTVPPLIAPKPRHGVPNQDAQSQSADHHDVQNQASRSDPAAPQPSASTAATPSPSGTAAGSGTAPGPLPCVASTPAPGGPNVLSARPSCAIYTTQGAMATLGTGWQVDGAGTKVLPGEKVPGTEQIAIRVETQQPTASVTLQATMPVGVPDNGRLQLRVYGARVYGTILRLSMSASGSADTSRTVVLTAPADTWTSFTVRVADLSPGGHPSVRRIDLAVATDQLPRAYRFFLDDIALIP